MMNDDDMLLLLILMIMMMMMTTTTTTTTTMMMIMMMTTTIIIIIKLVIIMLTMITIILTLVRRRWMVATPLWFFPNNFLWQPKVTKRSCNLCNHRCNHHQHVIYTNPITHRFTKYASKFEDIVCVGGVIKVVGRGVGETPWFLFCL